MCRLFFRPAGKVIKRLLLPTVERKTVSDFYWLKTPPAPSVFPWCQVHGISFERFPWPWQRCISALPSGNYDFQTIKQFLNFKLSHYQPDTVTAKDFSGSHIAVAKKFVRGESNTDRVLGFDTAEIVYLFLNSLFSFDFKAIKSPETFPWTRVCYRHPR